MAAAVAGYSHDHFQSLPNLNSARDNFLNLIGDKLVEDVFKDFFITNNMDRIFGLAMPHRHFDILPGQIIVNYNGTSTAWNATPGEGMDEPQPAIWSFSSSGELVPHEFRYSQGHKFEMGEKERAFVAEFKRIPSNNPNESLRLFIYFELLGVIRARSVEHLEPHQASVDRKARHESPLGLTSKLFACIPCQLLMPNALNLGAAFQSPDILHKHATIAPFNASPFALSIISPPLLKIILLMATYIT